ncbi:dihydrofolate reductase [bacterium SCSIO 12643]|nr:dihydrofolate reductase [bacterium SCSIO 12643]
METKNSVFIATSLDGYIADQNGDIDWLDSIPNPNQEDMGYIEFTSQIDALVMGRTTFETVCGFDIEWPYQKPVFVLSKTLREIPEKYADKVFLVQGSLTEVLKQIHDQGYHRLYIDGGKVIQSFLREDLIDEMIISTIPVLLGGGSSLFADISSRLNFECVKSTVCLGQIVQSHYKRIR